MKIPVSVPDHVLRRARDQVTAGKAKTLSALVSEAVEEKVSRDELSEILDAMDAQLGRPDKAAKARARRLFKR